MSEQEHEQPEETPEEGKETKDLDEPEEERRGDVLSDYKTEG